MAFIEELQRRLAPADFGGKSGAYLPISQSSPNLAAAAAAANAAAHHHQQQQSGGDHGAPFELRALEVALDVVSQRMANPLRKRCLISHLMPLHFITVFKKVAVMEPLRAAHV